MLRRIAIITLLAASACTGGKLDAPSSAKGNGKTTKKTLSATEEDKIVTTLTKKYESCLAKNTVWVPSVQGADIEGSAAGQCGAQLAPFCCSLPELKTRLTSYDTVESRITTYTDDDFQIYACSEDDSKNLTVHLIKRIDGETNYAKVSVGEAALADNMSTGSSSGTGTGSATATGSGTSSDTDTASGTDTDAAAAPTSCTIDLKKILQGEKVEVASGADEDPKFKDDINPLLQQYCDGGGCHASTSKSPAPYVDNMDLTKTDAATIADSVTKKRMPLGSGDKADLMSDDDRQKLSDLLTNW